MAHELPDLGYAFDALEPHIDARTMEIHHDRHHATYVANLNAALEGHDDLAGRSVEDLVSDLGSLPAGIQTAVRNNGGGHYNHSLFWQVIAPGGPLSTLHSADWTDSNRRLLRPRRVASAPAGPGW